jgi:hypothetical protein
MCEVRRRIVSENSFRIFFVFPKLVQMQNQNRKSDLHFRIIEFPRVKSTIQNSPVLFTVFRFCFFYLGCKTIFVENQQMD